MGGSLHISPLFVVNCIFLGKNSGDLFVAMTLWKGLLGNKEQDLA